MRYFYFSFVILSLFLIFGCETPGKDEGSSLPWSKPEAWETEVVPSIEE